MTDNFDIRETILDRLGCPEPELPGVRYIGTSNRWSRELGEIFDRMCMGGFDDLALLERALAKLEQVREHDYATFYLGRSELLSLYPIHYEPPTQPPTDPPIDLEVGVEPAVAGWLPLTLVALGEDLAS